MKQPMTDEHWRPIRTIRQVLADLGQGWRGLVSYDLICRFLTYVALAPLSATFLNLLIQSSGDPAVSNYDLFAFFLSWQGMLLIVVVATVEFARILFGLGGLAVIGIGVQRGVPVSAPRAIRFLAARMSQLVALGFRQFLILCLPAALLLGVIATVKATLLGEGDIYFYINVQPAQFWWSVAIVGGAGALMAAAIVMLLIRWVFAVPIMLLEEKSPRQALADSNLLARQVGYRRVAVNVILWAVIQLLLVALARMAHGMLRWALLAVAGQQIKLVFAFAGVLLTIDLMISILLGVMASASFAILVAQMYAHARAEVGTQHPLFAASTITLPVRRTAVRSIAAGIAVAVALVAIVSTYTSLADVKNENRVQVTAHRGSARAAPENTRSALLQAIEDGADFAEIDVQETADGTLVLFHDTDLRRIMGVNRRVWQVTFAEMRELDAGRWFGKEFAGERVISLQEAIETVRGKMDLIIEMKYHGQEQNLERSVVEVVRQSHFGDCCMVAALELRGVREIARLDPKLSRGVILTAAIGDPTRLDADAIAVNSQQVTRNLIARAHRAGIKVFVWTVNDPALMLTMIHMGVDNIFTSRPELLIEVLEERDQLSETERTLLYVADFLTGRL